MIKHLLRKTIPFMMPVMIGLIAPASATLQVVTEPGLNTSPTGTVSVTTVDEPPFGTTSSAIFVGHGAGQLESNTYFFRRTANPDITTPSCSGDPLPYYFGFYSLGAEEGEDNWVYICSEGAGLLLYNGWVKLSVSATTITPLLYVYDLDDATIPLTLPEAILAVEAAADPRDIQIKAIDFENFVIELHNYGPINQSLDGWQFCTHDEGQVRQYSSSTGLDEVVLEGGTSLSIWFNSDAPVVDADNINRSSIGGNWATPLDSGSFGMSLYFAPVNFNSGATIADHVQWSVGGVDNTSASERSDEAVLGGVWTDESLWIATSGETKQLILTDPAGGELHAPADYLVLPDFGITGFSRDQGANEVSFTWPTVNNLEVTVEKSPSLLLGTWGSEDSSTGAGITLTGQNDLGAFYRLSVPLP